MYLIYHVTSREHMLKGLCDFMGGSPLLRDNTLS